MIDDTIFDTIAALSPITFWFLYLVLSRRIEQKKVNNITYLMDQYRIEWSRQSMTRDLHTEDAILIGNFLKNASFFASTTILIIMAITAAIIGPHDFISGIQDLRLDHGVQNRILDLNFSILLIMYMTAFFFFTTSMRQINHFSIMIGSIDRKNTTVSKEFVNLISRINSRANRNFNQGIRLYYFSLASLIWFVSSYGAIIASLCIFIYVYRSEFKSSYIKELQHYLEQHDK